MLRGSIAVFSFCLSALALSSEISVKVVSVYDGDTFRVDLPGDSPGIVAKSIPVRINGIDTPEIRTRCRPEKARAFLARAFLAARLLDTDDVVIKNVGRGKFFRLTGDVYADGFNVGDEMIRYGLARPYDGNSARAGWCEKK